VAISNYTELQAALTNWLHRSGLDSRIPEFIALAESGLNKSLRLTQMVNQSNIAVSLGSAIASLPTGFLQVIEFTDDAYEPLVPVTNAEILRIKLETTDDSKPEYYTIDTAITFECESDAAYTYIMRYYKKWNIATDSTNWLLTNAPNVYLYASLAEAAPFMKDMQTAQSWMQMADKAIFDLKRQDRRISGAPTLRLDAGLSTSRNNILNDR
jgi:hypothetical protein